VSGDPGFVPRRLDVLVQVVAGRVERLTLMLEILPSLATSVGGKTGSGLMETIRFLDMVSATACEGFASPSVRLGGGELE